jgi:hypothetical protein
MHVQAMVLPWFKAIASAVGGDGQVLIAHGTGGTVVLW